MATRSKALSDFNRYLQTDPTVAQKFYASDDPLSAGAVNEDPQNAKLNAAFRPPWQQPVLPDPAQSIGRTDTRIDPFLGSGWDRFLDAAGAGNPGGVKMRGGDLPKSPVQEGIGSLRLRNALNGIGDFPDGVYVGDPNQPGRKQLDHVLRQKFPGAQ